MLNARPAHFNLPDLIIKLVYVEGTNYGNPHYEMFPILLLLGDTSNSHGDEYENGCLLGCCEIVLMMEAVNTSEMSVNFCQTTRRNISEDSLLMLLPRS
jgi:hypothetical protein